MNKFLKAGMTAAGLAVLVAAGAASVTAQESKEAAIKARQDFMKAQGGDVKTISEYVKGQGDEKAALSAAENLAARAPKIVALFPAGTSATDFPGKTKAKPEIWTEQDKFKAIPVALAADEAKLVDAIKSGNRQAAGAQLAAVGKNGCGACHTAYRLKSS